MKNRKAKGAKAFYMAAIAVIVIFTLLCILPFWLIVAGSLTSNEAIVLHGYSVLPKEFSLEAYRVILALPDSILNAYGVTIFVTVTGTLGGMLLISMAGYVLQRRDFKYRNKISFFIYFTTLFQGGLIPWYILLTRYLRLQDRLAVLILPGLMSPFLVIMMRNFIKMSVPDEVVESAKIDGAGDFEIYWRIVIRLAVPGMATIGLFLALQYWNDWFMSMLFITTPQKYSLQFFLYNMLNGAEFLRSLSQSAGISAAISIPSESTRLAMAVIVVGPIVFLYPFVQRYFVRGLTIGAVKG